MKRQFAVVRLLGCVLPGFVLSLWYRHAAMLVTRPGFPLDDAWIHAQFARNLATGHGFTYTGGAWVSGSTAPAWTILLGAGYVLTHQIVVAAMVLGLLLQAAAAYYCARIAESAGVPPSVAWTAGALTSLLPVMVWGAVSGMEVPMAAALVAAGLHYYLAGRRDGSWRRAAGIAILGLGALARPETLSIGVVVALSEAIGAEPLRVRVRRAAAGLAIVALAFAPLVVFSYLTMRRPLPTTFYAKSGPGITQALETGDRAMLTRDLTVFGPRALVNYGAILVDQLSWAAYLIVLGVAALGSRDARRFAALTIVVFVAVPYAMGVTAPQRLKPDNVRYAPQLLVLVAPFLVSGAWHAVRRLPYAAAATLAVGLLACAASAAVAWQRAGDYAVAVKNIQELQVTAARWLGANTPADAVVAVNDVGAAAYFSGRRILDLEGLVSPDVLPYRGFPDRGSRVVRAFRPDYIMIFPGWYPDIAASPDLREVHRFTIADNQISAGDTLVVYRAPWARD